MTYDEAVKWHLAAHALRGRARATQPRSFRYVRRVGRARRARHDPGADACVLTRGARDGGRRRGLCATLIPGRDATASMPGSSPIVYDDHAEEYLDAAVTLRP